MAADLRMGTVTLTLMLWSHTSCWVTLVLTPVDPAHLVVRMLRMMWVELMFPCPVMRRTGWPVMPWGHQSHPVETCWRVSECDGAETVE